VGGVEGRRGHAEVEDAQQSGAQLPVQRDYEPRLLVLADAARLAHALRLAITNAVLAGKSKRLVKLQLRATQSRVTVGIEDSGVGISPEMAGELSHPFSSRRPQGIGDALALFVASRLVAESEGELVLIPRIDDQINPVRKSRIVEYRLYFIDRDRADAERL
jgi:C4-dicarboxylate-specific signal transduction histidine kinase